MCSVLYYPCKIQVAHDLEQQELLEYILIYYLHCISESANILIDSENGLWAIHAPVSQLAEETDLKSV